MKKLIISGGSIPHGGWNTWKDFVVDRYNISEYHNLAKVGLGNESIINRAMIQASVVDNPIVIVMLTNIDKWDWYVNDCNILKQVNKERHTISPIHDGDEGGFWATGSHFPLFKEYYKKNYYTDVYQMIHTINGIIMLQGFCSSRDIPLLILFDSPIFSCLEHELNENPMVIPTHDMLKSPTIKPYADLINGIDDFRGLIGFCEDYDIPWYHPKFKGHPGSKAHHEFSKSRIFKWTDKFYNVVNPDQDAVADKMNKLWD